MKHFIFSVFAMVFLCQSASATHNRAGEITYRHISGNIYEITVYTYTKTSAPADRPYLPINWGDGSGPDSLQRDVINFFPARDSQENIYIKQHTFPGPGEYQICVTDPNRNSGILNIDNENSVLVVFALQTTLRISAAVQPNNSVYFTNLPLQDACIFQPWVYTPGAVDIDGDSLFFKLVPSYGNNCEPFELGFYEFPDQIGPLAPSPSPQNEISIDPVTGTITWESPQRKGDYNIAFIVEEWRSGVLLGTVLRDMQILVDDCVNTPPEIAALPDTCVEAGQTLNIDVIATDTESENVIISGFGVPFEVDSSPAAIVQSGQLPPVTAEFLWNTNCTHVRLEPYTVSFEAKDNGPGIELVDVETMNITVVAPAPENLTAEAVGSFIQLNWEASVCEEAIAYDIYRRIEPFGFVPSHCETGVPEYTGYSKIATVEGLENTSYFDEDEIIFGRRNCYMVVAVFPDGAESYASNEACAEIRFEIPIIKKNSVGITSEVGTDTVWWRSPIELDTAVFPGPYQYRLLRGEGYGEPDELVLESSTESSLDDLPTTFISTDINTEDTAHTYRVELLSGGELAARSNAASSLFIETIPDDNSVEVTWREEVPWLNYEYEVYRQTDGEGEFEFIGVTDTIGYLDTGLVNNRTYCYYIISRGSYFAVEENDTLVNFSQRSCTQPYDRTPPCPPELTGEADCVEFITDLSWTNPNEECPETDDVLQYNIYFAPFEGAEFSVIETIDGAFNTEIFYDLIEENSVSGCYAVTALDSMSLRPDGEVLRNESEFSNVVCFDNCPEYILPNVFTPNGDGRNDIFRPFPYRSVESIDLTIFNRWGGIVFKTTDPDILWDGTNRESGEVVSDGTYFYTCRVFSIRLFGLEPTDISGYISVFGEPGNTLD